ncbi:MAG: dihydrodipicolinate synthase family protein [Trueperaceae bacterium]|nr:MAG: dihydrodipicolinate synthase family protein [Trueperaceae bacterium]
MMELHIQGLVPAVFTPMHADGSLNLGQIGPIVDKLIAEGVRGLYVCGSTGEGVLLSSEERRAVAEAYVRASAKRIPVIVQVGHNSLAEARGLAEHAQVVGADAISAIPPTYFKPESLEMLIRCLAEITSAAPELPFYYYHIPKKTGVEVDTVQLLERSARALPNLVGIKYSYTTVFELQACTEVEGGRYNVLFGTDEMLLSGLAGGAHGAVGSTYNFATPHYRRIIDAFERSDLKEAQRLQGLSVKLVREIMNYEAMPSLKAMMKLIGLDCGASRLPLQTLSPEECEGLQRRLESIGFFEWGRG